MLMFQFQLKDIVIAVLKFHFFQLILNYFMVEFY